METVHKTIAAPTGTLNGTLRVPSDRSITVRAVLLAGIASGTSVIHHPLDCDDTRACMDVVGALTQSVLHMSHEKLGVTGRGLHGLRSPGKALFCGSSGATIRLLAGLMAGQPFGSTLDGTEQLRRRPMRRVSDPLRSMGARIEDADGCAPIEISGRSHKLKGITYTSPIASAQVKSAILFAGLYADNPTKVIESAPTRDHSERMLASMGVTIVREADADAALWSSMLTPVTTLNPLSIAVPADFSSAAFFMVAASIVPGAKVILRDVGMNDTRTGLLDCLLAMGASVEHDNPRFEGGELVADLTVSCQALSSIDVGGDLTARTMDELPVLAVAATQAEGTTVIRDAEELRVKESNRLEGFVTELRKMGAQIEPTGDGFIVEGPTPLHGAVVDSLGDHRVAMSLAVAALVATGETTITDAGSVSKTYPGFFRDLASIVS